jgi:hypothetical protein
VAARTKPASPGTGGHKTPDLGAHPAREQSVAAGKAARQLAPLESHRDFAAAASRDPVGLLLGQAKSRVPELVPVRHGRMLVSPFAYYRGAALPMAADLAGTRSSGLRVQLCGDAHLLNFGAFASPERRLVFDLNDFDETLPGRQTAASRPDPTCTTQMSAIGWHDRSQGLLRLEQRLDRCDSHQILRGIGELPIERDQSVGLELGQSDVLGVKRARPPELIGDIPCRVLKDMVFV